MAFLAPHILTFKVFFTFSICFSRFRDFLLTRVAIPTSLIITFSFFNARKWQKLDKKENIKVIKFNTSASLSDSSLTSSDPIKNCRAVTIIYLIIIEKLFLDQKALIKIPLALVVLQMHAVAITFTVFWSFQIFFL